MIKRMRQRTGQAALIVILVVMVALTIGVGIAGRSVTTISISTQEQERARAFSAAEAGIEDALRQNLSTIAGPQTIDLQESSATYTVTQIPTASVNIGPGEVITIDWGIAGTSSDISVTWPAGSGCSQLEGTEISSNGSAARTITTGSPASFSKTGNDRLLRLRLLNCTVLQAPLTVTAETPGGTVSFFQVNSLGTTIGGEANSRVQVTRSVSQPPGIMDYAIFSGGGIQ